MCESFPPETLPNIPITCESYPPEVIANTPIICESFPPILNNPFTQAQPTTCESTTELYRDKSNPILIDNLNQNKLSQEQINLVFGNDMQCDSEYVAQNSEIIASGTDIFNTRQRVDSVYTALSGQKKSPIQSEIINNFPVGVDRSEPSKATSELEERISAMQKYNIPKKTDTALDFLPSGLDLGLSRSKIAIESEISNLCENSYQKRVSELINNFKILLGGDYQSGFLNSYDPSKLKYDYVFKEHFTKVFESTELLVKLQPKAYKDLNLKTLEYDSGNSSIIENPNKSVEHQQKELNNKTEEIKACVEICQKKVVELENDYLSKLEQAKKIAEDCLKRNFELEKKLETLTQKDSHRVMNNVVQNVNDLSIDRQMKHTQGKQDQFNKNHPEYQYHCDLNDQAKKNYHDGVTKNDACHEGCYYYDNDIGVCDRHGNTTENKKLKRQKQQQEFKARLLKRQMCFKKKHKDHQELEKECQKDLEQLEEEYKQEHQEVQKEYQRFQSFQEYQKDMREQTKNHQKEQSDRHKEHQNDQSKKHKDLQMIHKQQNQKHLKNALTDMTDQFKDLPAITVNLFAKKPDYQIKCGVHITIKYYCPSSYYHGYALSIHDYDKALKKDKRDDWSFYTCLHKPGWDNNQWIVDKYTAWDSSEQAKNNSWKLGNVCSNDRYTVKFFDNRGQKFVENNGLKLAAEAIYKEDHIGEVTRAMGCSQKMGVWNFVPTETKNVFMIKFVEQSDKSSTIFNEQILVPIFGHRGERSPDSTANGNLDSFVVGLKSGDDVFWEVEQCETYTKDVGPIYSNKEFHERSESFKKMMPGWSITGIWWSQGCTSYVQYVKN